MAQEKIFKIVITRPAKNRYHRDVLPYIYENFSFERALEIDESILRTASSLQKKPGRGRKEKFLAEADEEFRFILHRETRHFEIKIIYFINEENSTVYITDFFPTKMDPQRINKNE